MLHVGEAVAAGEKDTVASENGDRDARYPLAVQLGLDEPVDAIGHGGTLGSGADGEDDGEERTDAEGWQDAREGEHGGVDECQHAKACGRLAEEVGGQSRRDTARCAISRIGVHQGNRFVHDPVNLSGAGCLGMATIRSKGFYKGCFPGIVATDYDIEARCQGESAGVPEALVLPKSYLLDAHA